MRSTPGQAVHLKHYREPAYRVKTVDLDFNLEPEETVVTAHIVFERANNTMAGAPLILDGDELELVSISLEGKELEARDYTLETDRLTIKQPPAKRRLNVCIVTRINPSENTTLTGLYRSGGNYCTQCEAEGFRRITFFPDRPDILAVYTTRIEAAKSDNPVLLGNGNPVESGNAGKGRHYAVWHDPHPKPSYLFALVAGKLGALRKTFKTMSGRRVKLAIHVQKGKEKSAAYAMDALVRSMKWDEEVYGCEYDLDVFNIVAVPDFNMGAMENKGLNIFNDKYVLGDAESATDTDFANIEGIIAHEYFHNWTGNRITCRDWFQLCLKEGLTVFRDQEFSADMRSRPVKRIADVKRLRTDQFPEDAGPLAHPVRPATYLEINNFYTATIYEKGAELVRMIATLLGPRDFRKGMNLYLRRHDGDAATVEQFIACFEKAAKPDFTQFMLWYSQAGTPVLNIASKHDKAKQRLTIEIEQVIAPTPGQRRKAPQHFPIDIALLDQQGNLIAPSSVSGADHNGKVFQIRKRNHKLVFDGIAQRPVASINRGFTAPVKVEFRQTDKDLAHLARHETDSFARWEALQTYGTRLVLAAAKAISNGKRPAMDKDYPLLIAGLAADNSLEPAFRTALMQLPGEGDIAREWHKQVDPQAVHKAHGLYAKAVGKALAGDAMGILAETRNDGPFSPDAASAGKRALSASIMRYGVMAKNQSVITETVSAYHNADNMTDRFNALATVVHHLADKHQQEEMLHDFYDRYHDNHIILDKWFSVQAMKPGKSGVAAVRRLMKHPDFTLRNPNRLRSVIAVFAMANPSGFNVENGAGYRLVADLVKTLDRINPQVAARLLTAFRSYKMLEPNRRRMAKDALEGIRQGDLSRDVSDILSRTLAD